MSQLKIVYPEKKKANVKHTYAELVNRNKKYVSIQERTAIIVEIVGFDTIRQYCKEAKMKYEAKLNPVNNFFSIHEGLANK